MHTTWPLFGLCVIYVGGARDAYDEITKFHFVYLRWRQIFILKGLKLTVIIKHFELMDAKNGPNEMVENPLNFNWSFKFLNLKLLPIKFIFSFPMK